MRVPIEDPQAWRNVRPRPREAGSTAVPPEQDAHLHFRSAGKANRLQRQANFDDITIRHDFPCAVPHEVRFKLLAGCGCVQRIHLDAARIREEVVRRLTAAGSVETETYPIIIERIVTAAES